ncbi:MAG: Lrp/AsnC family transcriptional regulator [Candidatus Bathyarchaeota archaeon]|nr:MAG: Lrp/AsnC family transcriptional regulator [Candidatus Bathyarchaeota archaeon]
MKELMMKLLLQLITNSSRSDRKLAQVLGVSQATVSRTRARLVKEGMIEEFTVIPNFTKMGFEIMAITVGKFKRPRSPEMTERGRKWMNEHPNIIFSSRASGMGKNAVIISLHKNYADYNEFFQKSMSDWADAIEGHDNILISLKGPVVKPLSLRYLSELFENQESGVFIEYE